MVDVLLFAPRFSPESGGSAVYFSNLVDSLSEECDYRVITFYNNGEDIISTYVGATVYRVIPKFKSWPSVLRLFIESTVSFLLSLYLLFGSVELTHVHAGSFASPGITLAASLHHTPIIYDCRDEMFPPRLVKIGRTPLWFSCAANVDSRLLDSGIPKERIVRVPVVNPKYVAEYTDGCELDNGQGKDTFEVIFAGLLVERKGVNELLKAFERFAAEVSKVHLTLVGDDPVGEITRIAQHQSLDNSLTLTGELSHRKTIKHISQADVLVLPSYDEAFPRVIAEAFELGTPVIATPVGAIPDLVDDGETGLLVDHSVNSLVSALYTMYSDDSLRQKLRTKARQKSQDRTWETVESQVLEAYREVAKL